MLPTTINNIAGAAGAAPGDADDCFTPGDSRPDPSQGHQGLQGGDQAAAKSEIIIITCWFWSTFYYSCMMAVSWLTVAKKKTESACFPTFPKKSLKNVSAELMITWVTVKEKNIGAVVVAIFLHAKISIKLQSFALQLL